METHPLVRDYLDTLEESATILPSDQREELVAEIREHIFDALRGATPSDEVAIRDVLGRLGAPKAIVTAAMENRPHATVSVRDPRSSGVAPLIWGILGLTVLPVFASVVAIATGTRAKRQAAAAGFQPPLGAVSGRALGWVGLATPIIALLWIFLRRVPGVAIAPREPISVPAYLVVRCLVFALLVAGCVALVVSARTHRRRRMAGGSEDSSVRGIIGWIGIVFLGIAMAFTLAPFIATFVLVELGFELSSASDLGWGIAGIMTVLAMPAAAMVFAGRRARDVAQRKAREAQAASAAEVVGWFVLTTVAASLPIIGLLVTAR